MTISLQYLTHFNKNCRVLGSLQRNERLWIFGNRMTKTIDPEKLIHFPKNPFFKTIEKIAKLFMRLILFIALALMGQSEQLCLRKIEQLTKHIENEIQKAFPDSTKKRYYQILEKLGKLKDNLSKVVGFGLLNLKKCLKDEDSAEQITKSFGQKVLPVANQVIKWGINNVAQQDRDRLAQIFKALKMEKPNFALFREMLVTADAFFKAALKRYAKSSVKSTLQNYGLSKKMTLKGCDVAAVIIGIVANLRLSELTEIFKKQYPLDAVNPARLCKLLVEERKICKLFLSIDKSLSYRNQLERDQDLISYFQEIENYKPFKKETNQALASLQKFGYTEYLSHLAYPLFKKGNITFTDNILLPLYDKTGTLSLHQTAKLFGKKGLYSAVVHPVFVEPRTDQKIQMVFRGTFCKSSLLRDIHPRERKTRMLSEGPGRLSFEKEQHKIVASFKKVVELYSDMHCKLNLEVMGHSLGGTDAQRLLRYFAKVWPEDKRDAFKKIKLFAFNSPGVASDVADSFVTSIYDWKQPFKLRYFNVCNDLIPECGTKRLGHCGQSKWPENLFVSLFKFNCKWSKRKSYDLLYFAKRSLLAHGLQPLKTPSCYIEKIYTNFDIDLPFGKKRDQVSKKNTKIEMNNQLVTKVGNLNRKIQKAIFKIWNVLTFRR